MRAIRAALLTGVLAVAAHAQPSNGSDVVGRAIGLAGVDAASLCGPAACIGESAHANEPLPFYRKLMAEPLRAGHHALRLDARFRDAAGSPQRMMRLSAMLAGVGPADHGDAPRQADEWPVGAPDPLAAAFGVLNELMPDAAAWRPVLPDAQHLPPPLRVELARLIAALGRAERVRRQALARLPASITAEVLLRQLVEGHAEQREQPDYREWLGDVDIGTLVSGMLDLVWAVEAFDGFLARKAELPALSWRIDTPLGAIVVDTTGEDNHHELAAPLLVVDVGGNDRYSFRSGMTGGRVSVLLDRGGDDHYVALDAAADPSAAVLGYGILWDTGGSDRHDGRWLAQGATIFGAALLFDGGGDDVFEAIGFAQGFALGGVALLVSQDGDDRFVARTHAQGAAGPTAAAVLVNVAGNDDYVLGNEPLVMPSAQLEDRNVSMGQGAGRGIRATAKDGRALAGGVGVLLDFAGDDRYRAQVFAQGAGFYQGAGLLVDGGGADVFEAAWYGMGASAHCAAAVFVSRGDGDDSYAVSHATSLGAAHDRSVAFFVDEGGNDHYRLGVLGIGAANDRGTAVFIDVSGNDRYAVHSAECSAFGVARIGGPGFRRDEERNLALFLDLGGSDAYESACAGPANGAQWTSPGRHADPPHGGSGVGIDGDFAYSFDSPRGRAEFRVCR